MTRIASIDHQFRGVPRIYLNFSENHDDAQCRALVRDSECAEALLDPSGRKSAAFVSELAESVDAFYVHTLHLAEHMLPWLGTGKIYVDIHGITPEEEELMGRAHLRERYEAVEQAVLRDARRCICVSEAMSVHYAEKYPSLGPNWLTIPVIAAFASGLEIASRRPSDDGPPVALYSGGVQAWQNLDAMLDLVESAGNEVEFRFLSHEHLHVRRRIEERKWRHVVQVGSCGKSELPVAYRAADFGLVLRDASPVNRVSCPTKLVEYLLFGLIPVVRSPHLGDFHQLGFSFVTEEEFRDGFIPDAATREWMAERNLQVVRHLAEQFHAGARELRRVVSGDSAGEAFLGADRVAATGAPPSGAFGRDGSYYMDLARVECREYLARKPSWVTRDQGAHSLNYTMGLVKHFKPGAMLEIGVSAGLASGAMLFASQTYDQGSRVYGIDIAEEVHYRSRKKVGALVDEAFPELRPRLELFLGKTCADIPDLIEEPVDFVYIDSLHSHPWPTLDALNALTRIREGGILAMDGVQFGAPGHDGSTYFFHHYSGDKHTHPGVQTGAIFVHDRHALFEHCCEVLELGWQVAVGVDTLKKTQANIEAFFGLARAERLRAIVEPRHAHFVRFEKTYTSAATIQWQYVELMQRKAAEPARASTPGPGPDSTSPLSTADEQFRDLRHFRRTVLDRHVRYPCRVLEVGAFSAPTADPSEAEVKFLDYHTTEELRSMARKAGDDPAAVVDVDYVCRTDDYAESVSGVFDAVIACHVFEHVDHAIRWLRMVRQLLRDDGILFLVLPDKKKSFDRFRPDTPLSHLLYEYLTPEQDVSSIHCLETKMYYDKTYIGEENDPKARLDLETLKNAIVPSSPGVHRHVFQAETFAGRILKPLLFMGVIDYRLSDLVNCPQFGEFAVVLRAGGDGEATDPGNIYAPAADTFRWDEATGTAEN